jgi:hypothetical protein
VAARRENYGYMKVRGRILDSMIIRLRRTIERTFFLMGDPI